MEDFTNRLDALSEKLIAKLERAIDELDSYPIKSFEKEKRVEYDEEGKKPIYEKISEKEEIHMEKGIVDRTALKQLVSTIKELRFSSEEEIEGINVFLSDESEELSK